MSVITLRQAIKAKLEAMQTIKAVYEYESTNPDGKYPLATITLNSGEAEFASTAHNLRARLFTVNIYQERIEAGQGDEEAERIIANVVNEMETAFDADTTLSGTCHYALPTRWVADYVDREHDSRLVTFTIEAVEMVTAR